jgi:hypothetical protein
MTRLTPEDRTFLRAAAVTSVLDATMLAAATEKIGRQLPGELRGVSELGRLSARLGDFLRFVALAEVVLASGNPDTAAWLSGFRREVLATCDRIQGALEVHDLARVGIELDWIAAVLADYPSQGGQVALALRGPGPKHAA